MKPVAIVIGAIGKLPYAGMTYYWLHHIRGMQELGFEVHYIERQNRPDEYYDSHHDTMTDDIEPALRYLSALSATYGGGPDRFTLISGDGSAHGSGRSTMLADLEAAAVVLSVADATWFDDLARCPTRIFIDGDPMFTQAAIIDGDPRYRAVLDHYPVLCTYATRMGEPDCTVPDCGRTWLGTRPVVATSLWPVAPVDQDAPLTALLHWSAGGSIEVGGIRYGNKDLSFRSIQQLPSRVTRPALLAVGGGDAPRAELQAHGWGLASPLKHTADRVAYQRFIGGSFADVGIAKDAYTRSRSGWYSDRATCFLASGRPVLHQDTGFRDWLPKDVPGVLGFSSLEELVDDIAVLESDYVSHASGARGVAEQYFEARVVLADILDGAGVSYR